MIRALALAALASCLAVTTAAAADNLPPAIQWEVIGVSPTEVTFIDTAPGRSTSSVEKATVVVFRVSKTPGKTPEGKPFVFLAEQFTFSCMDDKLVRNGQIAYDETGAPVGRNATPMAGTRRPGSTLETAEIWGCDHFNASEHTQTFTSWKAALSFARAKLGAN